VLLPWPKYYNLAALNGIDGYGRVFTWVVLLLISVLYYVSTDRVNQPTARTRCQSQYADLVSISDTDENNYVASIWSVY